MIWTELVENPQAIFSIFQTAPSLDGVDIASVTLDYNGPAVSLSVLLDEYPTKPSIKWQRNTANAVALDIQLLAVEDLAVRGWRNENKVTFRFKRLDSGRISVEVSGAVFDFRCSCGWIRINHISPYQRTSENSQ